MAIDHIEILFDNMAQRLISHLETKNREEMFMIGIRTGGVWVAERLHALLGLTTPLGKLDIAFYRDDFSRIGLHPHVKPSELPYAVEGKDIILVDDVLHSGRTIRAALNEIFDYGRPASVKLAVLVERTGRELPIQPDVIGCSICLDANKSIKICGPTPLTLEIRSNV